LVVEKETLALKEEDRVVFKGSFKLDPSKRPKALDLTLTKTENGKNQGSVLLAVYELDKDGLKLCMTAQGEKDRPGEFVAKKDTKHMVLTFKKAKPLPDGEAAGGSRSRGARWTKGRPRMAFLMTQTVVLCDAL
jgi:uncharacterized protein (TIGR03067 family)